MGRPADAHLNDEEIEELISAADEINRLPANSALHEGNRECLSHLATCKSCQLRVQVQREMHDGLGLLRSSPKTPASGSCPEESQWMEIVTGSSSNQDVEQCLEHATDCELCGPRLREALRIASDELTPREEYLVRRLDSARGEWQKRLAQRITELSATAESSEPRKIRQISWRSGVWPRLGLSAALMLVIAGVWWNRNRNRTESVDVLLDAAYTENRTMELRIPQAHYAPRQVQLGEDESDIAHPKLLKAENLIAATLSANPSSAKWLHAKGQADLLGRHFDAARRTLEEAHRLAPGDNEIEIDLASSYLLTKDYGSAVNTLRDVTQKNPSNQVAWFNLAIAFEYQQLYHDALAAWDSYLRLDSTSDWAQEAKKRRSDVQQILDDYKKKSSNPLLDPTAVAAKSKNDDLMDIDRRLEAYLEVAVSTWLPKTAKEPAGSRMFGTDREAIAAIALIAAHRHNDNWLKDMMSVLEEHPVGAQALTSLAATVEANRAGDYSGAKENARKAELQFEMVRSVAGSLRARLEDAYASEFLQQGEDCYRGARALVDELRGKSYAWLEIQSELQQANCANMTGRLHDAKNVARMALNSALNHGYPILLLRGTSLMGVLDWTSGDFRSADQEARAGLKRFWSDALPSMRGYNLYVVLDSLAADSEQWFLQVSIDSEETEIISDDPDHGLRAMAYQALGRAAIHSGELTLAEASFQKADEEFSRAVPGESVEILRADTAIGMAEAECQRGDCNGALWRLQSIEPYVRTTSNRFLATDFFMTKGKVLASVGDQQSAQSTLLQALRIVEVGLEEINGERERTDWTKEYAQGYRYLVQSVLEEDPGRAFEWWEWYKGAGARVAGAQRSRHALKSPSGLLLQRLTAEELNPGSRGEGVLISYIVLPTVVGGWVHDARVTAYRTLGVSPQELETLVERFSFHCADPSSDEQLLHEEARRLYDVLIAPFVPLIGDRKSLVIEPDGLTESVAFEALVDPKGRTLGDLYNVTISPGLLYVSKMRPPFDPFSHAIALVVGNAGANTSTDLDLPALPDADDEARQVAKLFPNVRLLLGPNATKVTILRDVQQADVFHFSGHALAIQDGSGLVLSDSDTPSELIDAIHIEKTHLKRAKLVVLSACSTAGSRSQTLGGAKSLARALIGLGVPQVVASRWPVDSSATRELITSFYRHLMEGDTAAEALRLARIQMRTKPDRLRSHPYYWAGFSVFGRS